MASPFDAREQLTPLREDGTAFRAAEAGERLTPLPDERERLTPLRRLDLPAILRVPYLDHGRDMSGWDCLGLCRWLSAEACGVTLPSWDLMYAGVRRENAAEIAGAIRQGMSHFEPCAPQFGAWLLFTLFGEACHLGWALDHRTMLHADDGADVRGRTTMVRGGGTYTAEFFHGPWKRRLVGAWMPKAAKSGGGAMKMRTPAAASP